MTPAPTLKGYVCRMCGNESIQTPWNDSDGFICKDCGATNLAPLATSAEAVRAYDRAAAGFKELGNALRGIVE